jgi:hypothetical protein
MNGGHYTQEGSWRFPSGCGVKNTEDQRDTGVTRQRRSGRRSVSYMKSVKPGSTENSALPFDILILPHVRRGKFLTSRQARGLNFLQGIPRKVVSFYGFSGTA